MCLFVEKETTDTFKHVEVIQNKKKFKTKSKSSVINDQYALLTYHCIWNLFSLIMGQCFQASTQFYSFIIFFGIHKFLLFPQKSFDIEIWTFFF